jgi:hypothetical protein
MLHEHEQSFIDDEDYEMVNVSAPSTAAAAGKDNKSADEKVEVKRPSPVASQEAIDDGNNKQFICL